MTPHKKIAYVQAAWHADITDRCKQAFTAELAKQSSDESGVDFFSAPGKGQELAAACLSIIENLAAVA